MNRRLQNRIMVANGARMFPILQVRTAAKLGMNWQGTYYRVKCPDCKKERWIHSADYHRGKAVLCKRCSNPRIRILGNKIRAEKRENTIKKLLVCPKCGGKVFEDWGESWTCLCGRSIYKDRVILKKPEQLKLANLVKV